jgi:hypothetical protein
MHRRSKATPEERCAPPKFRSADLSAVRGASVAWAADDPWSTGSGVIELVRSWGERVSSRALDALDLAERLDADVARSPKLSSAVTAFFGADRPAHAFNVEPLKWLRMTEPQSTRGLALFLQEGGSERILPFLRALHPELDWPHRFDRTWAEAEVPAGRGRIDLLLRGRSGSKVWGAVIEAKFSHHVRSNPLPDYRKAAISMGLQPCGPGSTDGTAVLAILGQFTCATTQGRLNRNRDWEFIGWQPVLRRFERELAGHADDEEFRTFRRTLWERTR